MKSSILNPYLDGVIVVKPGRCNLILGGMARNGYYSVNVSFQFLKHILALEIPDVNTVILGSTHYVLAICH